MQLKKLSFKEASTGWSIQDAEFSPFTLLVGASGVGKTRILRAITTIAGLTTGKSYNGIEWRVELHDALHGEVVWEGKTEYTKGCYDSLQMPYRGLTLTTEHEFNFIYESLKVNGKELFKRENGETNYRNKKTVKLQKNKSLFYLLQEDRIIEIKNRTIILKDSPYKFTPINDKLVKVNKFEDIESLLATVDATLSEKLFVASKKYTFLFEQIKEDFLSIFPFVEDLQFRNPTVLQEASENLAPEMQVIHLKEYDSNTWVSSWDFSSGMHKVLALISTLCLSSKGSVILIDEFENSFGINCIDAISQKIIHSVRNKQVILTSHHPYIINAIPREHWKLVTRKSCQVCVSPVADKLSSCSKHESFIQLINLEEYVEGIKS